MLVSGEASTDKVSNFGTKRSLFTSRASVDRWVDSNIPEGGGGNVIKCDCCACRAITRAVTRFHFCSSKKSVAIHRISSKTTSQCVFRRGGKPGARSGPCQVRGVAEEEDRRRNFIATDALEGDGMVLSGAGFITGDASDSTPDRFCRRCVNCNRIWSRRRRNAAVSGQMTRGGDACGTWMRCGDSIPKCGGCMAWCEGISDRPLNDFLGAVVRLTVESDRLMADFGRTALLPDCAARRIPPPRAVTVTPLVSTAVGGRESFTGTTPVDEEDSPSL